MIKPAITGSTGIIGSYLAYSLIRRGVPILLIGRPPDFEGRAKTRIGMWGAISSWERVRFAPWPDPSPCPEIERWNPSQIIHAAAETHLGQNRAESIVSTNLDLLARVEDLCARLKVQRIDFLSTAYVCGSQPSPVEETRHLAASGYRNPYEESKWRCEERLFSDPSSFPGTRIIHRPSLILPPASHARAGTPKAFLRVFERLNLLAGRGTKEHCSVGLLPSSRPGFVHLTAFAMDLLEVLEKDFPNGTRVFHYSSREIPPISGWVHWLREALPSLDLRIGTTCPRGRRVLGELEPYLHGHFLFDQSNLGRELGRKPYSQAPLSEVFFRDLVQSLIRQKPVAPRLPQGAMA